MGTFSVWHWLIVLVVVLVLFGGGGKIPKLMRDMGQGVKAFKRGPNEPDNANPVGHSVPQQGGASVVAEAPAARVEEKDAAVKN